ncbi:MAG: ArnT family glycosyltransferase, partial [Gaiellaceae bacterium]
MEVPGRSVQAPRRLSGRPAEWTRAHAAPVLALAAALAASVAIVAAQPVRSAWWTYADADATYTAAGLNLLLGEPLRYLDHPGLPLEELIAGAFGIGELADGGTAREYVDGLMLDFDRTRAVFRGLAIGFYLSGALLSFLLAARLFGHWGWGLAAGLAWTAAPGLASMSIQYRPDVPLAVLCVVFAFLVGRAVQTRSASVFLAAGFTLGFATMVKLHAAGLLPALMLAAIWRHPAP